MLTHILCTAYAFESHDLEVKRLFKHQNQDINLFCGLTKSHEEFNRNITVTWHILKTCQLCLIAKPSKDQEEWKTLDAKGLTLTIKHNSDIASGFYFYMCKMFPYRLEDTTLEIEITKTFQVEVVQGKKSRFAYLSS